MCAYVYTTSGQPVLPMECLGAQRSHGSGQSVHEKSQNFLKHNAGCQLKTFKTFILMVKPLKPLFFSEKPLKTFI